MKRKIFLLSLVAAVLTLAIAGCQREGCTDPKATNYDSDAKKDNGTCVYAEPEPIPTRKASMDMTWYEIFHGQLADKGIADTLKDQSVETLEMRLAPSEEDGSVTSSFYTKAFRRGRDTLQNYSNLSSKLIYSGTIIVNRQGGLNSPTKPDTVLV